MILTKGGTMIRKVLLSTLLLIALAACTLSFAAPGNELSGGPTTDPQVLIGQAVLQTFDAQTHIAQAVQQTLSAMVTNTPEFPFTPSFTPTLTFTLLPAVPLVSVSVQTNCRFGPGTAYDVLGIVNVGQTAEVVGRSASSDNWIIKLPSNPAITCWLWGFYAAVVGDTSGLPVIIPPPTPTPPPGFTSNYTGLVDCSSNFAMNFKIINTGNVNWKSLKVDITDYTTSYTFTYTHDGFNTRSGCSVTGMQDILNPGEEFLETPFSLMGYWSYNPSGHNIIATITLYSENGLKGISISKTITFTP
jgi:hypothetical protein